MSKIYCTIAVESCSVEQVSELLNKRFGLSFNAGICPPVLGLFFHVYKSPSEWLQAPYFDDESDRFYKEFDVSSFECTVDIFCGHGNPFETVLYVIADAVGKEISEKSGGRVLVFFDETNVPFCLYESGIKTSDFRTYYDDYIKKHFWKPS